MILFGFQRQDYNPGSYSFILTSGSTGRDMLKFRQNASLDSLNALRLSSSARWFCEAGTVEEVQEAVAFAKEKGISVLVLGGGTNLVLSDRVDGLVIHNRIPGRSLTSRKIELGAGEDWSGFVEESVRLGITGFENLALIPGSVGAAPVQNIGAYGVELSDRLVSLKAMHLASGELQRFSREECGFSYRDSLFKRDHAWCILSLELQPSEELHATYPGVRGFLVENDLPLSSASVFQAVCALRRAKLPDVSKVPNVGSFFKNPILDTASAEQLIARYPDMPHFADPGGIKLSAAWLIDSLELKGLRQGGCAISEQHSLVIVNDQGGSFDDLLALVQKISFDVVSHYGVELEVEPSIQPPPDQRG